MQQLQDSAKQYPEDETCGYDQSHQLSTCLFSSEDHNFALYRLPSSWLSIPQLGAIPAGLAEECQQIDQGCLAKALESMTIKPTTRTFVLRVQDDSMIGRHIVAGDLVILQHALPPRTGDVVENKHILRTAIIQCFSP